MDVTVNCTIFKRLKEYLDRKRFGIRDSVEEAEIKEELGKYYLHDNGCSVWDCVPNSDPCDISDDGNGVILIDPPPNCGHLQKQQFSITKYPSSPPKIRLCVNSISAFPITTTWYHVGWSVVSSFSNCIEITYDGPYDSTPVTSIFGVTLTSSDGCKKTATKSLTFKGEDYGEDYTGV